MSALNNQLILSTQVVFFPTQYSAINQEDLSHYKDQPDRLLEELKRMKFAKEKAEHFAAEAKQSAQKVEIPHYSIVLN